MLLEHWRLWLRALWIEDDELMLGLIRAIDDHALRRQRGVSLAFASTLREAEDILRRERFDVVVLDLGLPDCRDPEILLTRICWAGSHRIVLVSGSGRVHEVAAEARRIGVAQLRTSVFKGKLPMDEFQRSPRKFHEWIEEMAA